MAIDGEKVTAIGKNVGEGKKEIDAKGMVVAPGFIDSHTHMDAFVVQYPNGNPVVNYGVTSIVIGDCGASCAPVPPKPEPRQVLVQYLRRVLPAIAGLFVSLIKDSSLLSVIGVSEYFYNTKNFISRTYAGLEGYVPLAIGYLILTLPVAWLSHWLEKRFRDET